MTQHLNLLPPRAPSARDPWSLEAAVVGGAFTLAAALAAGLWVERDRASTRQAADQLQREAAARDAQRASLSIALDPTLARQLTEARAQRTRLDEAEQGLRAASTQRPKPFSPLFEALARQRGDGLWLTAVSADGSHEHLTIVGRALHADLVPSWLERLQREPLFRERRFGTLALEDRPVAIPGDAASPPARVVEFRLQSPSGPTEARDRPTGGRGS